MDKLKNKKETSQNGVINTITLIINYLIIFAALYVGKGSETTPKILCVIIAILALILIELQRGRR